MSEPLVIHEPAVLEITQGRKRTPLRWETREEGRALIAAIARKNALLPGPVLPGDADFIDAVIVDCEIDDDEPQPRGEHPYPDEPVPDALAGDGETAADRPEPDVPAEAEPYPPRWVAPGRPRCKATAPRDGEPGDWWTCTAQPFHDGPDHIAHLHGGVEAYRWPADPAPCVRDDRHGPHGRCLGSLGIANGTPPHHCAPGEAQCAAEDEDEARGEVRACSAQHGHGGPDHVTYGAGETVLHRWPVTYDTRMSCGDTLTDAAPYGEGAPMWCPRHGETAAISEAQWLEEHPAEPVTYPAGTALVETAPAGEP